LEVTAHAISDGLIDLMDILDILIDALEYITPEMKTLLELIYKLYATKLT
jgi:hypothetical protein